MLSGKFKVFDCNIVYLPGHINPGDTALPAENTKEIPFGIAEMRYLPGTQHEEFNNIHSECVIIALSGSFDVKLDDGANKKTVHLNKASFGLYLKAGIQKQLAKFSSDAICLILIPHYLPLVSVGTCSYNNSKFIIETLDSIKSQTYPNIELIIVDDCSTDDSVEVINEWLKTYDGNYKFIRNEVNMGGNAPGNICLKNSTGKYFSGIDSDDAILPEKIAIQVEILEASGPNVAGVYSNAYLMDVNSSPMEGLFIQRHRQFPEMPSGNIYNALLQGNYIPFMSFLIKRFIYDDVGYYDETLVYADYDMWLRMARKYDILYSDFVSSKYRIRPGSLSYTIRNWKLSDTKIFLKHVGAPLPMGRIRKIAWDVYTTDDGDTIPFLKELADKTLDRYLLTACLLWKIGIPKDAGVMVLDKLNEQAVAGDTLQTNESDANDLKLFINEVLPVMPVDMLHNMARRFYIENDPRNLSLLSQLADHKRSRYLLAAHLLAQYRIPVETGDVVLRIINEVPGQDAYYPINGVRGADARLFMKNIYPALPLEVLKAIGCNAYCNENEDLILLVKELAEKTNDRYFKAAWLLWKFKIRIPVGAIILERINEYCKIGKSNLFIDLCIYKDIFEGRLKYN